MAEHIKNRIATTMGMEGETDFIESRTRLFEMGIDSVTALELQATLETDTGMDLPATLIFDYPTVEDLTIRLLKLLAQDSAPQNSDPKPLPPDLEDSIISSVQDLAEEEILNQLIRG